MKDATIADYAEPLIKAKQALKDYEQAVLHGKWDEAYGKAYSARLLSEKLVEFAWSKRDSQP